ncbi:MAG TPA: hypothetical protein VGJ62_13725 [Gemmatimonadaceae bacterium]|jgi:predicted DNA-binding protein (UPF0278 family)
MKKFLKWSGINIAAGGAVLLAHKGIAALRVRLDRGLAQAERVTEEARQAMQSAREALAHTEHTIEGVGRTVS